MRVQVHAADAGGCGHYRLIWPSMAIHYAGLDDVDVDLITPDDGAGLASFDCRADLALTLERHGIAALEDIAAGRFHPDDLVLGGLSTVPDADVVVIQRPLTDRLVDVVRFLKAEGIAVVVEVDDDFRTIHPRNIAWRTVHPSASPRRNYRHLAAACELADLVVVTTPALADRYGRHGRVRIIPNYVPSHYLGLLPPERPADDAGIRVGWSGAFDTHPTDLQVTRGGVAEVLRDRSLPFYVVGDHDDRVAHALGHTGRLAHTGGWLPLSKYPVAMSMLDVGIVPLDDIPFNHAKSWLKGLEFAALGVPFVASPTGPYRELHDRHGIGILAGGRSRDWRRELERLVADDDWRAEVADRNRLAASELTIEGHVDEWVDAWRHALNLSTRNRGVTA